MWRAGLWTGMRHTERRSALHLCGNTHTTCPVLLGSDPPLRLLFQLPEALRSPSLSFWSSWSSNLTWCPEHHVTEGRGFYEPMGQGCCLVALMEKLCRLCSRVPASTSLPSKCGLPAAPCQRARTKSAYHKNGKYCLFAYLFLLLDH